MSWWGSGKDKPSKPAEKPTDATALPIERKKAFDPKLPELEKLPDKLQKIVDESDKNESFYDELVDG
jgi:mitochondrial fission process protein 1